MKKILLGSAFAFAALSLQSCFHDDKELFDDSAAVRIEKAVEADKQLLESAPNGWQLRYYTGQEYSGGGYTMYVKFKDGKAYASSDIAPADSVSSSSYDVIKDKGPVITFNTLNGIMHYLAQPYQNDVDGEQGDYEFVIMRTTNDSIYVKGKKWGNSMVFTRVAEDVDWEAQIDNMHKVFYSMKWVYTLPGFDGNIVLDPDSRRIYLGPSDDNGVSFYVTTDGIGFREPITLNGKEVSSLRYDAASKTLSSTEAGIILTASVPEGYHEIDDFVQSWNLKYYDNSNRKYTTVPFAMQGMTTLINQKSLTGLVGVLTYANQYQFAMRATYSTATGTCTIPAQYIEDPTGTFPVLMMLGLNSSTGRIYYADFQVTENADTHQWALVDPDGNADSILLLGADNQGNPYYVKSDDSYTTDPDDPDVESLAALLVFYRVSTLTAN